MSAFSAAIDAIFADPNMAADALFLPGNTAPGIPVRVVRRAPDEVQNFGSARVQQATTTVDVRVSDVAAPAKLDGITIGDDAFVIQADPQRDSLRLVWTLNLRAV